MNKTQARIESYTLQNRADLYVLDCPACGIVFAIPEAMEKRRRKDGQEFWCPNGHSMSWYETEADRLKAKAARLQAQKDQAEADAQFQRQLREQAADEAQKANERTRAARDEVARTRKRAANGVCPCCNRSFVQLQRHMASKHPDFMVMAEVPGSFAIWPLWKAVELIVVTADEPLQPDAVLGRLVLAGRTRDARSSVTAALYRAERNQAIVRVAPKTWASA